MNKKFAPFQKSHHDPINFKKDVRDAFQVRMHIVPLGMAIIFFFLFLRLFHLTVVKGAYYRYIAENNRIKEVAFIAPRGDIIDRMGLPIAMTENSRRVYPLLEASAHLVGYQQLANDDDIKNDACSERLKLNDKIGKNGIEKIFECDLRGIKGKRLIEVDANGKPQKILSETKPIQGKTLQLSVDSELQKKAYQLISNNILKTNEGDINFKEKRAAVVAIQPKTGQILVMTSSPSFNPQSFEDNNQELITAYLQDESHPLFNRALEGKYPPGSVFKPVLASGALQDGTIDEQFTIEDTGTIKAGPLTFGNWYFLQYGKTEGTVNVVKGLKRSNDIFFYKTGEKMGVEKIKYWAQKFGYGEKSGIPLHEEEGLIPTEFWKKDVMKERWYLGDTYNMSIGQGYIQVTPLQVNRATAVIANGGTLCKPQLLKNESPQCTDIGLSQKTVDLVREGMHEACLSGGTGWPFFDFRVKSNDATATDSAHMIKRIEVGCKTGTAESHKKSGLPHAWFTVFAPYDNPEIVVTVMVEESGEGSNVAAPIAKELLKTYFERSE